MLRFGSLLFLIGCSGSDVEFKITPGEQGVEEPKLVKLYMETSASMKGYAMGSHSGQFTHVEGLPIGIFLGWSSKQWSAEAKSTAKNMLCEMVICEF